MSKSKGNVVAPQKVDEHLGADILRLWVAATDYSGELSISDEILKRVVESYRRIRNTIRFLLANLSDFEIQKHGVPEEEWFDIDRYMLLLTQDLQIAVAVSVVRRTRGQAVTSGISTFIWWCSGCTTSARRNWEPFTSIFSRIVYTRPVSIPVPAVRLKPRFIMFATPCYGLLRQSSASQRKRLGRCSPTRLTACSYIHGASCHPSKTATSDVLRKRWNRIREHACNRAEAPGTTEDRRERLVHPLPRRSIYLHQKCRREFP